MGSLYHLGQKLVDFANIITKHANRNDTVPSSSLVYKGAKNIATIEDSNVASQAYSVGNFLILDGQLYRVTNAIAQGGTITVGTNVTLDSVGSELKSLNDSLTTKFLGTITYNGVPFTFRKAGNLVYAKADGQLNAALPTSWTNIGTLDVSIGLNYNAYAVLVSNSDFLVHLRVSGKSVDIYAKTSSSNVYVQSASILA